MVGHLTSTQPDVTVYVSTCILVSTLYSIEILNSIAGLTLEGD